MIRRAKNNKFQLAIIDRMCLRFEVFNHLLVYNSSKLMVMCGSFYTREFDEFAGLSQWRNLSVVVMTGQMFVK